MDVEENISAKEGESISVREEVTVVVDQVFISFSMDKNNVIVGEGVV